LERRVCRISVALSKPDPLNSICTIWDAVRNLDGTRADIGPSLVSCRVTTVPIVWRRASISSGATDLIAFIIDHRVGRVKSILRIGLLDGYDAVSNESTNVIVSPPMRVDGISTLISSHLRDVIRNAASWSTVSQMAERLTVTSAVL